MSRFAGIAAAAAFAIVQVCCAPPLFAVQPTVMAAPAHCPMQAAESCETSDSAGCGPVAPLVSDVTHLPSAAQVHLAEMGAIAAVSSPYAEIHSLSGWWAAPTKTIQLRI